MRMKNLSQKLEQHVSLLDACNAVLVVSLLVGQRPKAPWDRRNESTIHTGMSKFGIITKKVADGPEQGI